MSKYKACICEGGAETAIMDLLLDQNKLIGTTSRKRTHKIDKF